jgi:hypothetical protein
MIVRTLWSTGLVRAGFNAGSAGGRDDATDNPHAVSASRWTWALGVGRSCGGRVSCGRRTVLNFSAELPGAPVAAHK